MACADCGLSYHELFFMIDTCQANTMYSKIYSPNVLATGSSHKDQNSYSVSAPLAPRRARLLLTLEQHGTDDDLGIAMSDRFTLEILDFMEDVNKTSERTMQDLVSTAAQQHLQIAA